VDDLRPEILHAIQLDGPMLAALSPQGQIDGVRVPVFLLHGATDDIIPSTESLWLAKDVPRQDLRAVLITPAFAHVDPDKKMRLADELRLVHFIARFLSSSA
jgi:pimeloyl-ACP methyl ester carboxylesterase